MAEYKRFLTQKMIAGDITLGGERTITGNTQSGYSETLGAGDNPTTSVGFAFASLQSFFAVSSVDMTLNPDGSMNPNIDLLAGIPFVWTLDSGLDNPFVANVTSIVVTNVLAGDLTIDAVSII